MTDEGDGAVDRSPAPADAAQDPAISYPRGNRLGLRHPRPTVVIVVAVVVVVGAAYAWSSLRATEGLFCGLAGTVGAPAAESPEAAFDAWWGTGGEASARSQMTRALGRPVDGPARDDFEHVDERRWMWRIDDTGIAVDVGRADGTASAYRVLGVNSCGYDASP